MRVRLLKADPASLGAARFPPNTKVSGLLFQNAGYATASASPPIHNPAWRASRIFARVFGGDRTGVGQLRQKPLFTEPFGGGDSAAGSFWDSANCATNPGSGYASRRARGRSQPPISASAGFVAHKIIAEMGCEKVNQGDSGGHFVWASSAGRHLSEAVSTSRA
jgi:hypothetical protein